MKFNYCFFIFLVFLSVKELQAQKTTEEPPGDKLFKEGDITGAIEAYKKQIKNDPGSLQTLSYNLACAYAKNSQHDSAFKYLYIRIKYDSSETVLSEADLLPLRRNTGWPEFEKQVMAGIKIKYSSQIKDYPLAAKLWELAARDQAYFYEIDLAEKKLGMDSPVVQALWTAKDELNQKNIKELDSIIQVKGWPKKSDVGNVAAGAAFYVIQHSNLALQQKYLPIIKALCETNEASWSKYALMFDRVRVLQKKPQLYGTQIDYDVATQTFVLFPIEDEKNVDKRRTEMGLGPLADYVSQWEIKYVPVK